MPQLNWTAPALADLRRINSWLLEHRSADLAARTLAGIRERALFLEQFPHGGRPERDGTRVLRVSGTPFLLLYRLRNASVEILRIRHEREDWLLMP